MADTLSGVASGGSEPRSPDCVPSSPHDPVAAGNGGSDAAPGSQAAPPARAARTSAWHIYKTSPVFQSPMGLARVAYVSLALGIAFSLALAALGYGLFTMADSSHETSSLLFVGLFYSFLAVYHVLEFTSTALFHPETLSADSFLVNHSPEWYLIMAIPVVEFIVWEVVYPFRQEPQLLWVTLAGVCICIVGQWLRTAAMWTAGFSFTHVIQTRGREQHVLVNWGVYKYLRHPGYFGFFWWLVSLQLLLLNPVSLLVYCYAGWKFFSDRVPYEERTLLRIFGDEYARYKRSTIIGIPFVFGVPKGDN